MDPEDDDGRAGLPHRLRVARLAAGMTQAQLGVAVGRSKWSIGRYERGVSEPDTGTLYTIAGVLGTEWEWLVTGLMRDELLTAAMLDLDRAEFKDRASRPPPPGN